MTVILIILGILFALSFLGCAIAILPIIICVYIGVQINGFWGGIVGLVVGIIVQGIVTQIMDSASEKKRLAEEEQARIEQMRIEKERRRLYEAEEARKREEYARKPSLNQVLSNMDTLSDSRNRNNFK